MLQTPCPSVRIIAAVAVTPRPIGHDFDGQGTAVANDFDMAHEAAQGTSRCPKRETQAVSLGEVLLGTPMQSGAGLHDALPGQGKATSTRLRLSSLA